MVPDASCEGNSGGDGDSSAHSGSSRLNSSWATDVLRRAAAGTRRLTPQQEQVPMHIARYSVLSKNGLPTHSCHHFKQYRRLETSSPLAGAQQSEHGCAVLAAAAHACTRSAAIRLLKTLPAPCSTYIAAQNPATASEHHDALPGRKHAAQLMSNFC